MPEFPCPRCGHPLSLHAYSGKIVCENCNLVPEDRHQKNALRLGTFELDDLRGVSIEANPADVTIRATNAYNKALEAIHRKKGKEAIAALEEALDEQPDLIEAHLLLGQMYKDPLTRAEHLNAVLEHVPKQPKAYRLARQLVGLPDETGRKVTAPLPDIEPLSETAALREIVELPPQVLRCDNCGAVRTAPDRELPEWCPFCGNTPILHEEHDLSGFQPRGLVPLRVTRKTAMQTLKLTLQKIQQDGKLDANALEEMSMDAVFIPFWVFDVDIDGERQRHQVPAVMSPPPATVAKMDEIRFDEVRPFRLEQIERVPALVANVTFEDATKRVRTRISKGLRRRNVEDHPGTSKLAMNPQMILLPAWNVTIFDTKAVRVMLIDGTTSRASISKATAQFE